jgi:hypothetical protein
VNLDDSAQSIITQYENNKETLVAKIGQVKYDEELEVLNKCKDQEKDNAKFEAVYGDVDTRDTSKHDITLSKGFKDVQCGIKGSKLSGG